MFSCKGWVSLLLSFNTRVVYGKKKSSIGYNKAPGHDGYNSRFFKNAWYIIKDDLMEALHEFFEKNKMIDPINCALVTLVPKVADVKNRKDLRPIACCLTIYKIISKIITKRLSRVINEVVDCSQSAFFLGRVIHDSILMAHELLRRYSHKNISPRCAIIMDIQKLKYS